MRLQLIVHLYARARACVCVCVRVPVDDADAEVPCDAQALLNAAFKTVLYEQQEYIDVNGFPADSEDVQVHTHTHTDTHAECMYSAASMLCGWNARNSRAVLKL